MNQTKSKLFKLAIVAGGTGGHIFPAMAVAKYYQSQSADLIWYGTEDRMESWIVPDANIEYKSIAIHGLRGKGIASLLTAPFMIIRSIWKAIKLLKQDKPDVMMVMGGYVSGPFGVAAKLLGIPLVLHEQNAIAGTTNKLLFKIANQVLLGMPGAFDLNHPKVTLTGNPLRSGISAKQWQTGTDEQLNILVVGGSLGAQIFNERLPAVFEKLKIQLKSRNIQMSVLHQTGKHNEQATRDLYSSDLLEDNSIRIQPFINDMAKSYEWADLVICRAGAMTLAELTKVGVPSILVPLPTAIDDHQSKNADVLVQAGVAVKLLQQEFTQEKLIDLITNDLLPKSNLLEMAKKAQADSNTDATLSVVTHIDKLCHTQQ